MKPQNVKILGIADGDPYDFQTWSGSSSYLFNALKANGYLYHAISALPSKIINYAYKFLAFNPNIAKWKFRYHLNVNFYNYMTKVALNKIHQLNDQNYNVILQIGGWYDLTGRQDKLIVSYNDGNLHTLLKSPYGYPRINSNYIEKTLNYEKKLYEKIDYIFTMSKWLSESFIKDFGINVKKIFPVGAGINLPYIKEINNKCYDENNILFVGRDFNRKGGHILLEAFQKVKKEIRSANLTLIGPKIENPPEGVRCLGFISKFCKNGIDSLLDEYSKASIFVMPSLYEPFGIVFAEAMAHKLSCIGTSICAMPEIIENGVNGYIVPPQDSNLLAKKIIDILKDTKTCREMGNNAYDKYLKNYRWDVVISKMIKTIEDKLK
jgi:glycosyltransferase involved in cell wall biosynthesis